MKKIFIVALLLMASLGPASLAQAQSLNAQDLSQIRPEYLRMLSLLQTRLNLVNQQLKAGLTTAQMTEAKAELVAIRRTLISLTTITVWASNNNQ